MAERVAIVGSREHPRLEMVREYVRSLPAASVVLSGAARGVDAAAEAAAIERGLMTRSYEPQDASALFSGRGRAVWHPLATRDRMLYRNTLLALACDRMVVFPDGSRGGCWDAAREAHRFRRPVEVRWVDGRVHPYRGEPVRVEEQRSLF